MAILLPPKCCAVTAGVSQQIWSQLSRGKDCGPSSGSLLSAMPKPPCFLQQHWHRQVWASPGTISAEHSPGLKNRTKRLRPSDGSDAKQQKEDRFHRHGVKDWERREIGFINLTKQRKGHKMFVCFKSAESLTLGCQWKAISDVNFSGLRCND